MTKLWSLLMLKLSRIIVAIKNAFKKRKRPSEETEDEIEDFVTEMEMRKEIKAECEACDYCEECGNYFDPEKGCVFAESDKGIPCYWEVDDG